MGFSWHPSVLVVSWKGYDWLRHYWEHWILSYSNEIRLIISEKNTKTEYREARMSFCTGDERGWDNIACYFDNFEYTNSLFTLIMALYLGYYFRWQKIWLIFSLNCAAMFVAFGNYILKPPRTEVEEIAWIESDIFAFPVIPSHHTN